MLRQCEDCRKRYDDAEQFTFCPHGHFLSASDRERKDLAFTLLGKPIHFAYKPDEILSVESISHDGMVTIRGYTGEFAPHLFRVKAAA